MLKKDDAVLFYGTDCEVNDKQYRVFAVYHHVRKLRDVQILLMPAVGTTVSFQHTGSQVQTSATPNQVSAFRDLINNMECLNRTLKLANIYI